MTVQDLVPLVGKPVVFTMGDVRTGKDITLVGLLTQVDNTNPLGMDVVRLYTQERGWVTTLASCVQHPHTHT